MIKLQLLRRSLLYGVADSPVLSKMRAARGCEST